MAQSMLIDGTAPERPEYPKGVPSKFSPEGLVQPFAGNSVLCHLPPTCPLLPGLQSLYHSLRSHELSRQFAILPPSSWHITLMNGVCDSVRIAEKWPPGKASQTLDECTNEFSVRLKVLGRRLGQEGLAPPYRLRVVKFKFLGVGIGIHAQGVTEEEEKRLRRLRDRIADAMGFRHADHETYEFHITLTYSLKHHSPKEKQELSSFLEGYLPLLGGEFELLDPEFCTFANMCSFQRLFLMRNDAESD